MYSHEWTECTECCCTTGVIREGETLRVRPRYVGEHVQPFMLCQVCHRAIEHSYTLADAEGPNGGDGLDVLHIAHEGRYTPRMRFPEQEWERVAPQPEPLNPSIQRMFQELALRDRHKRERDALNED